MRIGEKMRKWISMILCLCMLVQNAPMMVFAASTDNLCEHHPKHTEDCGYVEAVAGSDCTHKHSKACYEIVECKHTCSDECDDPCTTHTCTVDDGCITMERDCHHVHGECGYAEAVEPQDCTTCQPVLVHAENCGYVAPVAEETCDCVPGEDGTVTHIEGCGYVAPVEEEKCDCEPTVTHGGEGCTYVEGKDGSPCTHVCAVVVDSADSCYKLLCSHKDGGHDDACGYAAAVEGHECHYECSACEDNAGDDSPVPEGVCAHGNSEESCETCVGEIQVMINALPDMEDIGDHNRADVISQLEAIDDRMWKLSDAAKGKLDADKYVDAAFVLSAPEGFFGFLLTKRYEAGASAMPQASFAFLDASGVAATVITPEEQQTTSVEPVSNGGAVRGYLPVGEYTLDETVVGDWNLTMSVNGQAEGDHTFTGEGGRGYRIETINFDYCVIQLTPSENGSVGLTAEEGEWEEDNYVVYIGRTVTLTVEPASGYELGVLEVKPENSIELTGEGNTYTFVAPANPVTVTATFKPLCEHTTKEEENKATCKKQAVCDLCGESYGEVNKNNHDETMPSEEYDNGFCSHCGAYQSATLNAEGYYEISNAGQLYWFAEQVNSSGNYSINGKLMEDILVNENVLNSAGIVSSGPFRTWYPIGSNEDVNYSGTFNGNGKTISGLYFDDNNEDGVGLFGYVDSGKIQNVGIKDSYFNGRNNVGSVVAHNHKGTVTGCYNTGTVSGGSNVGGVVGKNDEGTVTDCYNSGRIGSNDCNNVGGVLGGNTGTVSGCYNTGSISGRDCVGGVAGYSGGKVSNCYNTGEVYGQNMVGGVLGLNEEGSELINCYNTGKVSGGLSVGGVAGENYQGTISKCYYLKSTAAGGIDGEDAAGQAEAMIKNLFASGAVAYLLGVPFGQNIDNDQTKQEIPCFSNAIVYRVKNCKEETVYSNTNENIGHKWENGVCSICGNPCSHSIDNTTGKCQHCKTDIAVAKVEIGDTTYFKTLDEAVDAAENATTEAPATLTLLQDIDLEGSSQEINSGVMTLDLNGCTLAGSGEYVLKISGNETSKPDVTITDNKGSGKITGSGESSVGVHAKTSNVEISGGTITGTGEWSFGVHANGSSTVEISGGTISGTNYGVDANESSVEISGGTITAFGEHSSGVNADESNVKISGGTISGISYGVNATSNSTVEISGGEITGAVKDLRVDNPNSSITLTLGGNGTVATFPGGLNVEGTTLDAILDKDKDAAYWKDGKMISLSDNQTAITGGDVTVEVECEHEKATYPAEYITNTQHKVDCPCGYVATEDHTFDSTTGKCSACGAREIFFEADVSWNEVYAYYWVDSTRPPVTWPGVELTKNDGDPRYRLFVPGDTAKIVFNDGINGQNKKTEDLELGVKNCYHYDGNNGYWYSYPCTEHTWGKDGKCSNCQKACPHNSFNSTTGLCTDCDTDIAVAMVEIGDTTTKFKTLAGAVDAAKAGTAEAPATLTLLKNINLGESDQKIESGVFTLDLNGCTLAGIGECVLHISGGETHVTITDGSEAGTGTISGTGGDSRGVYAYNSTVEISGGAIIGTNSVVYAVNSTVTISGGEVSSTDEYSYGVFANESAVTISGGKISAIGKSSCAVYASINSTVKISGGTITGTNFGVNADKSTVTISGGEVSSTGQYSYGVYATSDSAVTITGGTITATGLNSIGVYPSSKSTVEISGGTITGTNYGVQAYANSTVTISGGAITGRDYGVYAYSNSTVTITGGEISGDIYDLNVYNNGSITLGLGEDKTGATFPEGLTVDGTTLVDILANGAAYWQDTQMIFPSDGQTEITGGDVTVKAPCEHTTVTYSVKDVTDATKHKVVCPCGYENLEDHTFDDNDGKCSKCKTDLAEASVKIGDTTYYETLDAAITAAESCVEADNAVVTLLKDINLGESYQKIDSGVFTLDLNGCTLAGIGECVLHISGAETHVTITDGSEAGTGTISGTGTGTTTSSGCDGVRVSRGTLTIKNGTISGTSDGVYVRNGNLSVAGGTISGCIGVDASSNSTVEISGGTITVTGDYCVGVDAYSDSNVEISGGTITATGDDCFGVLTDDSTVKITGGEISATGEESSGVYVWESTVTISGGEISGNGENSYGVYAYDSTVEISGGTITDKNSSGMRVESSTVTITGGTITGEFSGVSGQSESIVIISGGIISGKYGVTANKSTVTITGSTITGGLYDLRVLEGGSITLGLGEDDIGATFPEGLTVDATTLVDILAEGAAYWQGTKMLTNIADDAITITGGTVTVKAQCKHTDVTYPDEHITDTHHTLVCSCGYVVATESHTRTYTASGNVITESCSQCKATFGTATITANGKTYNGEAVTAAVQKTGALSGINIGITYSQNGEELNESAIRAGTYTASIKLGDAVAKVEFTITPATLPNAVLSATGYTYNGQQQKPDVTVTGLTENTDYTVTYPQDVTNAGEKTVTITGKGNYTGTVTKSYSIAKADSIVTKAPQAAANLVYNGKNQNLVSAGTVTGGTLQYSLDGKTWTARIPVGKAAGTYTVSYKVVGDANHKDIAVRTLAVTIAKGTAPAVDALVQTHFYAYATANTVDLAKYLPADRGTTAYTAIGVSADIFSSVLSVTNAGVLSYTTRKLTAAPASDTQISIKVVMENYADAELTVTVKLLAVTEQTQQKIVKEELTEVPAGLSGTRFDSVDAIKTEQKRVLGLQLGYDPQGNIFHHDVKLQFSPDGGKTWVDATEENFPANGLTVTLPYPSGTGKDTHNFVVSHMFTTGAKAGTIETPAVTKTADGIQFTVNGLSPVSVAWSAIPFDVKVANVTNGTVCVSSEQAAAGTQVTITATPKSGYRLSTLTVKDAAGNFCVVSTDNNGKYYFTMPAADVTVTATFTAKSTAVADTTNPKTGDDSNLVFWNSMAMTSLLALAVLMLDKKKLYQK